MSKKSFNSLKVPKKAAKESTLEPVEINSNDFTEEIGVHLQDTYRFRKLANEAIKIESAWLIHNRSLDEEFVKARKRMQIGDSLNQAKPVNVSSFYGFLFTKSWTVVKSIATNGLKAGNVQSTRLGKPENGVVLSQCADIGLAHLSYSQSRGDESYYADELDLESDSTQANSTYFYIILVRWLKSKVYVVSLNSESEEHNLDPQPNHTCHMTKWSRMDPLDPNTLSLSDVFHYSQVYLYEYNDDFELKTSLDHVVPFAVVKCQWNITPEILSTFNTLNDGLILISCPAKNMGNPKKSLLGTPPSSFKIPVGESSAPNTDKVLKRGRHMSALFTSPATPSCPFGTVPAIPETTTDYPKYPIRRRIKHVPLPISPIDPLIASGRARLAALDKKPFNFVNPNGNIPSSSIVNTCYLVWPVSHQLGHSDGTAINSWQFPVDILSFYGPTAGIFEGLLFPRLVISDLISFSHLHHELAGIREPITSPLDPIVSSDVRDPRRLKEQRSNPAPQPPSPCLPYVRIDRLREWTVPNKENVENVSCEKPGQFAGYKGNYFLLTLPEDYRQQEPVIKLFDTLKMRELACLIKMPCQTTAVLYIFPDSEFSKSIGIPRLIGSEATSFHGILLLPHSLFQTPIENSACLHINCSGREQPVAQWSILTSQFVSGLPNGGENYRQKSQGNPANAGPADNMDDLIDVDDPFTFTPMSPQEALDSFEEGEITEVLPIPDAPVCGNSGDSSAASCDMELETSIDSNIPISPVKSSSHCFSASTAEIPVPEIPVQVSHQFLHPNAVDSDYNAWIRQRKEQEKAPESSSSVPRCEYFSPESPEQVIDLSAMPSTQKSFRSRNQSSRKRSPKEEEEGEIVDDDEESDSSSEKRRSSHRHNYNDSRFRRDNSRDQAYIRRRRSPWSPSSMHRKRSRYSPQPSLPRHRSPPPSKRRDRRVSDVDYRTTVYRPEKSPVSPRRSRSKPVEEDMDYRGYDVYIPKCTEQPKVHPPVKVFDYNSRNSLLGSGDGRGRYMGRNERGNSTRGHGRFHTSDSMASPPPHPSSHRPKCLIDRVPQLPPTPSLLPSNVQRLPYSSYNPYPAPSSSLRRGRGGSHILTTRYNIN
nr:ATPase F1 V1 A1 complex alpha beta subunit nucleotide binding domain active site [Hymenolepis microstoma]